MILSSLILLYALLSGGALSPSLLLQDPPEVVPEDDGPGELVTIYHESGKKAREGRIWKGRRHGLWRAWHESGELAYEGRIENYQRVGVWKNYFQTGKLRS
ncbi:MAG: hypothetical protein CL933_06730, partial [Deltaproteobacteria bacterium]|nr:hypothetical protein [Deltaproteobacteria bacterium]